MNITRNGIVATITPYYLSPGNPNVFQSTEAIGPSVPMEIVFDIPVTFVAFDVYDIGFPNNTITAYDSLGQVLHTETFPSTILNSVFRVRSGIEMSAISKVKRVQITPGIGDYIAFGNLTFRDESNVPTWTNGLTNVTSNGTPPATWVRGGDGKWYPPNVQAPVPPTTDPNIPDTTTNNTTPHVVTAQFPITVTFNIGQPISNSSVIIPVHFNISSVSQIQSLTIQKDVKLKINPIRVNIKEALNRAFKDVKGNSIRDFFDQDRVSKTLLNFGNDYQTIITNWKYDNSDIGKTSIFLKLYRPLPSSVVTKRLVWISREIFKSYIDTVSAIFIPDAGIRIYLRPPNKKINARGVYGIQSNKKTLTTLLSSGAFDDVNPNDDILQQWYVNSLDKTDLNVEYHDYSKFVFYGSAVAKLQAFQTKMILLEQYNNIINRNAISLTNTGSANITGSTAYVTLKSAAEDRLNVLRSFDGYERFLYYDSPIAYSSSFSNTSIDQLYFHEDATWPKSSGVALTYSSASITEESASAIIPTPDSENYVGTWYNNQLFIASEYDRWNKNAFHNNIPSYLFEDYQSDDYITFIKLIGHQFDHIKLYIDHMSMIYDRNSNPSNGLSNDLIWNVAKSFGIELPNQYSIKSIADYIIGEEQSSKIYKELVSETWKRFLHNHMYLMKSKGTKSAIRGLMNTYGILPSTINIKESTIVSPQYFNNAYQLVEEKTNVLNFSNETAYINIPLSSSGIPSNTIHLRVATTSSNAEVLFNADSAWALTIAPLTGSYGRIEVVSGSTLAASSSYVPLFDGEYYSITLQNMGSNMKMFVKKVDNYDLEEDSETTSPLIANWYAPQALYLGGSGSLFGSPFNGYVDEFRLSTEIVSESILNDWARYPGLYHGNSTTSARDNLYVRLSFNNVKNLGSSSLSDRFVQNESPYIRTISSAPLTFFSASGFSNQTSYPYSHKIITRQVAKHLPNAGNYYDSNKVIIYEGVDRFITGSSVPILSRTKKIVSIPEQETANRANNIIGLYFSPIDTINDTILQSMGQIDINDLIGSPDQIYNSSYNDLLTTSRLFWNSYSYQYDFNRFIDFIGDTLSSFFQQARQLVPARSKLLTGIIIEPNILERSKIENTGRVGITGGTLTKDSSTTHNLDFNLNFSQSYVPTSEIGHYDVIFESIPSQIDVLGNISHYDAEIPSITDVAVLGAYSDLSTLIDINSDIPMNMSTQYHDGTISTLDNTLIAMNYENLFDIISLVDEYMLTSKASIYDADLVGNITSPYDLFDEIKPRSDFNDIGARTYFTYENGLIGELVFSRQRKHNIYNDVGVWTPGNVYSNNDLVLQLDIEGDGDAGNEVEFYCIATSPLISNMAPALDHANWRRVPQILTSRYISRKAVVINNVISLVPLSSGLSPVATGYRNNHYIRTRDTSTATNRRLYSGCKQTSNTTFDGKSPIEIIQSPADSLFVNNSILPVVPPNNPDGPILDVR